MASEMSKIDLKAQRLPAFFFLCLLLTACSFQSPVDSADPDGGTQQSAEAQSLSPSEAAAITSAPQDNPEPPLCQEGFEGRELREPYQRNKYDGPRYTLSDEELRAYLDLMGIESICLPPQFGSPFINVDWNSLEIPATGRMVSIGFEELYGGGGWSSSYLVYATYDFSVGSEYEVFASPGDFEQVQTRSIPGLINIDGVEGFVRFHPGIPMGMQTILKTYVFPFEGYYIAAVINLGAYDPAKVEDILLEMAAGKHPDLVNENVAQLDLLVSSIRFR